MILINLSTQVGYSTMDIVSRIYDIHREYIDQGLIGFRPAVAYADAVDKGQIILAIDLNIQGIKSIVGFAHYRRLKRKGRPVRLYAIAVESSRCRQRIGSEILEYLETCNGSYVFTEVREDNINSLEFFKNGGYEVTEVKSKGDYKVFVLRKLITMKQTWFWDELSKKMLYITRLGGF